MAKDNFEKMAKRTIDKMPTDQTAPEETAAQETPEAPAETQGAFELSLNASDVPELSQLSPGETVEIMGTVRSNENGQIVLDAQLAGQEPESPQPGPAGDRFEELVAQRT